MSKKAEKHANHREVELMVTLRGFGGSARTSNLANALNVSEETVRRTVKALAKSGLVQRVHGGVYLTNAEALTPLVARLGKRTIEKARIATRAIDLIPNGSCVFLDVGSTTAFVAEGLKNKRNLTIVTNGLHAAQALMNFNENRVFLAGGELQMVESGAFGTDTINYVARFNFDVAIFSVDGIDPSDGFLLAAAGEAELARNIARRARRTIVVADHNKFGQGAPMIAYDPADVDTVITDTHLRPVFADFLKKWEIELLIAGDEGAQ